MNTKQKVLLSLFILFTICIFFEPNTTFAAFHDSKIDTILDNGTGVSAWDSDQSFVGMAKSMLYASRAIIVILAALAGTMICLNLQEGMKTVWYSVLALCIIINVGSVLSGIWSAPPIPSAHEAKSMEEALKFSDSSHNNDFMSQMLGYYLSVVLAGSVALQPIAFKLTLFLAMIDITIKLAFDFGKGNVIETILKELLKVGLYVFLITSLFGNNMCLLDKLSTGFQEIGFLASGQQNYATSLTSLESIFLDGDETTSALKPDSIYNNAMKMVMISGSLFGSSVNPISKIPGVVHDVISGNFMNAAIGFTFGGLIDSICSLCILVACAFTAIQMLLAHIEFYTLGLLSLIVLPFGVFKHTEFMSRGAIQGLFTCGLKVCVISFLQGIFVVLFNKLCEGNKVVLFNLGEKEISFFKPQYLQMLLFCTIMAIIVKKIPEIVSAVMQGGGSFMGASDMMQMVGSAVRGAATVAGVAAGGVAAGSAMGAMGGSKGEMLMSSLKAVGQGALKLTPGIGNAVGAFNQGLATSTKGYFFDMDGQVRNAMMEDNKTSRGNLLNNADRLLRDPKSKASPSADSGNNATAGGNGGGGGGVPQNQQPALAQTSNTHKDAADIASAVAKNDVAKKGGGDNNITNNQINKNIQNQNPQAFPAGGNSGNPIISGISGAPAPTGAPNITISPLSGNNGGGSTGGGGVYNTTNINNTLSPSGSGGSDGGSMSKISDSHPLGMLEP